MDDWDVVRAAQVMIEVHGKNAAATADHRAESSGELQLVKRWTAIARAIRKIGDPPNRASEV